MTHDSLASAELKGGVTDDTCMPADAETRVEADACADARALTNYLAKFEQPCVAFSGGVDSSVVAAAAMRARGDKAIAITADSPSVPRRQLTIAKQVAAEIGIQHQIIATDELELADYRRNDGQRCFHCKQTLYRALASVVAHGGQRTIVSGTNADDLGDYRPGIRAGQLAGVVTPLADLGLTKARVRAVAKSWGLSVQDLPASPCLSSRVAYGVEVTPARLHRIEVAEDWLLEHGLADVRVRLHVDDLARLEIDVSQWHRLQSPDFVREMNEAMRALGFKFVTLDLQGRRSGSLNDVLVSIQASAVSRDAPAPPSS